MQTRKSFFKNPILVALLGCTMAFAVACGDDDDSGDPAPGGGTKATGGTGGTGASAGKGGGGSSGSAGKKSDGGEGNAPTTGGTDNNDNGGGGGEPPLNQAGNGPGAAGAGPVQDCSDEADVGCFCGKPSSLKEFLNACPTTGCEPFDNDTLTSLKDNAGVLPDLP